MLYNFSIGECFSAETPEYFLGAVENGRFSVAHGAVEI